EGLPPCASLAPSEAAFSRFLVRSPKAPPMQRTRTMPGREPPSASSFAMSLPCPLDFSLEAVLIVAQVALLLGLHRRGAMTFRRGGRGGRRLPPRRWRTVQVRTSRRRRALGGRRR